MTIGATDGLISLYLVVGTVDVGDLETQDIAVVEVEVR